MRDEEEQRSLDEHALRIAGGSGQGFYFDNTLRRGANPNAVDAKGVPLLHKCIVVAESKPFVDAVLSAGGDPNIQDAQGRTALHLVFQKDYPAIAEALILAGGDLSIQDHNGKTPYEVSPHVAQVNAIYEMAQPSYDGAMGQLGDSALHRACRKGDEDLVGVRIHSTDYGINEQNIKGETALHVLAPNSPQSARLLVARGADPNIQDKQGRSALMMQTTENREAMMKGLEDHHHFEYEQQQKRVRQGSPHQTSQNQSSLEQGWKKGGITR